MRFTYLAGIARKHWVYLPQVAETNTPRSMDVAGDCLLYDGYVVGILVLASGGILKHSVIRTF